MFAEEAGRGIGPVDLETLVSTTDVGDAQIMQDATEEDEFVVVVDPGAQTVGGRELTAEQIAANAVESGKPQQAESLTVITSRCPTRVRRTSGSLAVYPSGQDTSRPRKVLR